MYGQWNNPNWIFGFMIYALALDEIISQNPKIREFRYF